ncbi:MAG TPA: TraR/DksA family transcriptional regulator [Steroidobacter sp.]|jgi:RNA polymerase-binding transcription factor DksA
MSTAVPDLEQVRQRLLARRRDLSVRRRRVENDLSRRTDPLVPDFSDQAIQLQNDETLQAIGEAAASELAALNEALARLDQGLYGICKVCGEEISPERLAAVPHAVTCTSCAAG